MGPIVAQEALGAVVPSSMAMGILCSLLFIFVSLLPRSCVPGLGFAIARVQLLQLSSTSPLVSLLLLIFSGGKK